MLKESRLSQVGVRSKTLVTGDDGGSFLTTYDRRRRLPRDSIQTPWENQMASLPTQSSKVNKIENGFRRVVLARENRSHRRTYGFLWTSVLHALRDERWRSKMTNHFLSKGQWVSSSPSPFGLLLRASFFNSFFYYYTCWRLCNRICRWWWCFGQWRRLKLLKKKNHEALGSEGDWCSGAENIEDLKLCWRVKVEDGGWRRKSSRWG